MTAGDDAGAVREEAVAPATSGLLLAAGSGSRLGTPKALVDFHGERLVDRGVRVLRAGGCRPVVVVLGAAVAPVPGAVTVRNPEWASGMGSSLRAGLEALPAAAEYVVIALVDQPLVGPEAVRRLIRAAGEGASVAVATYGGRRRNPVLIAREHFAEVARLAAGDTGARPFLRANPGLVVPVPCDDAGDPADIDTPADLAALRAPAEAPAARAPRPPPA
ncbi:nicotine blue oxidoreductase [Streptosporangium becharense]|uniref:Nicotine blue oxidoreductase n=1 Tax=Streptosporangium becharense TaxID=1816182 RepID=A0A7W9IDV8_9ACTN|nr:nucleotidyltransferase family protein [Streptosporangium becharense]MBB2912842.1 nicotine blue oxidoreductase [Streptosporangium becharense]MBB5818333.1 nicotine blue oxidoreductase [Streptosporangium becharense]